MPAGDYDKLVTIEAATDGARNSYGEPASVTWASAGQRWAKIEDGSGRELVRVRQVDPSISAVITLRERFAGLNERHRITYGERTFNVSAVLGQDDRTAKRGQIVHVVEEK